MGDEIVQLYIRDEYATVVRPVMELKSFKRITLEPGEQKSIIFPLNRDSFFFYDEQTGEWVVEPGDFNVMVGSSSADIRVSKILTLK